MPVILDETVPADMTFTVGPGPPRHAHAYPDESNVALCGTTRKGQPHRGGTLKCPTCVRLAGAKAWIGR